LFKNVYKWCKDVFLEFSDVYKEGVYIRYLYTLHKFDLDLKQLFMKYLIIIEKSPDFVGTLLF